MSAKVYTILIVLSCICLFFWSVTRSTQTNYGIPSVTRRTPTNYGTPTVTRSTQTNYGTPTDTRRIPTNYGIPSVTRRIPINYGTPTVTKRTQTNYGIPTMSINNYMRTHSPHEVKTDFLKHDNNAVLGNSKNTRNGVIISERSNGFFSYNNSLWTFTNDSGCMRKKNFILGHLRYKKRKKNIPIYLHPPDNDIHISRVLLNGGSWEENNLRKAIEVVSHYPDAIFIDIGSHVGVYSLTLASLGYKVIAIDCFKDNIERLCASAKLGNLSTNMYIIHNALSDKKETVVVRESSQSNIGGNTIVQKSSFNITDGKQDSSIETIQAIRLDDLLEVIDIKSAVLKLDVEGSEHNVLKGAETFFSIVNVYFVMTEFHIHKDRDSGKFISAFMNRHGFKPILPTGISLTNQSQWPWDVQWSKRGHK